MNAYPPATSVHPVVEALELLVRKWNPPHRPPLPIRGAQDERAFELPPLSGTTPWRGSYLRGLDLAGSADVQRLALCDLRGAQARSIDPRDQRFDLLARLRAGGLPSAEAMPELVAPQREMPPGHLGPVSTVAFSADGRHLASGGRDGCVRLWGIEGGQAHETCVLPQSHEGWVSCVAFSPRQQQLASVGSDNYLRLWTVEGGAARELATLQVPRGLLYRLAFSADGRRLAATGEDGIVRLWEVEDTAGLRETASLEAHAGGAFSVAFSRDGRQLVSAGEDGKVRLWDISGDGARGLTELTGHQGRVRDAAFSPADDRRAASAGSDGTVRLWALETGEEIATLRGHQGEVNTLAYSHDGRLLATAGTDGSMRLWDMHARGASEAGVQPGHNGPVSAVVFSPDGRRLATGGSDGSIRLWALLPNGARLTCTRRGNEHGWSHAVAFAPDGSRLASAHDDGCVRLWTLPQAGDAQESAMLRHGLPRPVHCVAFSPDGSLLASDGGDGTVQLRRLQAGVAHETEPLRGPEGYVTGLAFSLDGRYLACADNRRSVRIWTLGTEGFREYATLEHPLWVNSVAFDPQGRRLATGCSDGAVRLWPLEPGARSETTAPPVQQPRGQVRSVAFSPDGLHLASGSEDGTLSLWRVTDGFAEVASVQGQQQGAVTSVAFSPDGLYVACGGGDGSVRMWSFSGNATVEAAMLSGHQGPVHGLAFSPDGRRLASAGKDGSLRLWARHPQTDAAIGYRNDWTWIGKGLAILRGDDGDTTWTLARADGKPFETMLRGDEILAADPCLYEWLWFESSGWGHVPAFEVPPRWLEWSEDRRRITVSRAPHARMELLEWARGQP